MSRWCILVTLSFGAIGFYDDYLKVTKQSHKGFSGKARLLLEVLIAATAVYVMMKSGIDKFSSSLTFPFFKGLVLDLGCSSFLSPPLSLSARAMRSI